MDHNRFLKSFASTALACALLGGAVFAAPMDGAEPQPDEEAGTPAYEIARRGGDQPILVYGKAVELGDNSFTIQNDDETGAYNKVVVNVAEDTAIVDAVTGEAASFADLEKDAPVYAYVGPTMTRSLPPIATARVILLNAADELGVPTYAEVQSVTAREDGGVDAYVTGEVILHLGADTEMSAYKTKDVVAPESLKPGARLLSWYSMVALSMPAQATPTKVVVFPYDYAGYLSVNGMEVSVNGTALALTGAEAAKAVDGRLLVPVRKVAEALDCEVGWQAGTNAVTVMQGGEVLYSFTIGDDKAEKGDVTVGLVYSAEAVDGVTFMAVDDLLALHGLKLEEGFFF